MRSVRSIAVLAIISILAGFLSISCDEDNGAWYTFFYMEIDSLSAPAEVMQTDTLRVTFYSKPMGCCYNFYRYEPLYGKFRENTLRIRMIGRETHNLLCACLPRAIEMEYEVTSMLTGYYYIEVVQPDGSILRDSVLVYR